MTQNEKIQNQINVMEMTIKSVLNQIDREYKELQSYVQNDDPFSAIDGIRSRVERLEKHIAEAKSKNEILDRLRFLKED